MHAMKIFSTLSLFLFSIFAQEPEMPQWLSDIYEKNNQYFELECSYFSPSSHKVIKPISITQKSKNYATRDFLIQASGREVSLKFELVRDSKSHALIYIDNKLYFEKKIKRTKDREFYLPYPKSHNSLELNDIFCEVNFAENIPVEISGDTLLNIHPHTAYDWNKLTVAGTSKLSELYPVMIMLEDGNYKGNIANLDRFLENDDLNLPQNYWEMTSGFNESAQYVISPAGHNRFVFNSSIETKINYTGGNHNYCIWNNTRNLLRAYFKSYNDFPISINYHMDSIVAQIGGIISGLSFSRKSHSESPLLINLLKDDEVADKYITSYHQYFTDTFINEFKGYFKSLTITTRMKDRVLLKSFKGTGHLDKKINFNYIE